MAYEDNIRYEQTVLNETIRKISNKTYYIWDEVEKKTSNLKNNTSSVEDGHVLHSHKKELRLLERAQSSPYFGRLDVHTDENGQETFYIGKQGVRDKEGDIVVLDWRRPMASTYYNFTPGEPNQHYTSPSGKECVYVTQKREFTIKNQKIIKIIQQAAEMNSNLNKTFTDKGEELTVTDEFLREIIENSETSGYLKEIIATIQQEQNIAIRQPISRNLIVQGVAGSGKSSIALHRLSYLLYNNQKLKPEDFLILGPSNLFINSFKDILPDLDLNGINQSTFQAYALQYLSGSIDRKIKGNSKEFFEDVLFKRNQKHEQKRIEFKGSAALQRLIDEFVEAYKVNYTENLSSFALWGEILHAEDLKSIFERYTYLPFAKRVEKFLEYVKNHYLKILNEKVNEIRRQYEFITEKYMRMAGLTGERYNELSDSMKGIYKYKKAKLETEYKQAINEFKETNKVPGLLHLYKQILSHDIIKAFDSETDKETIEAFYDYKLKDISYFDLPPLLYLYFSFYGEPEKIAHLVIDEAQDLSFMHFAILKKTSKTMTILGDIDQSIYQGYGQQNWEMIQKNFFSSEGDQLMVMNTSYRSTKQVINAANTVLSNQFPGHSPINAINRSGPEVSVEEVKDSGELMRNITSTIETWAKKYERIVIIHRNEQKAERLAGFLTKELSKEAVYIHPEDEIMNGQISVLASYNCKGMEFDAVLLVNINEEHYPQDDLHARLLYVLLTRAQKELKIFYQDRPSPLLRGLVKESAPVLSKYDDIL